MKYSDPWRGICETTTLRQLLLSHPRLLRVLLAREVPVECAGGTVADAALACGMATAALVAELEAALTLGGPADCPKTEIPLTR